MTFAELLGILLLAVILAALFFYGLGRTGPWGSFWSFLLIILLGIWVVDLWIEPYGPIYWGVAWLDLLLVGLVFALLLAAASPPRRRRRRDPRAEFQEEAAREDRLRRGDEPSAAVAIGGFFWILMLVFLVLIFLGYWI